jgi:hypothetical protein
VEGAGAEIAMIVEKGKPTRRATKSQSMIIMNT